MGGRILANSRAIVLQQCGKCRQGGRMKGQWIRAQTTRSERISCKGLCLFHDIVITNMVLCMAYQWGVGEASYIA